VKGIEKGDGILWAEEQHEGECQEPTVGEDVLALELSPVYAAADRLGGRGMREILWRRCSAGKGKTLDSAC
jgi:hypothetical protein